MSLIRYTPRTGLRPFFADFDRVFDHLRSDTAVAPPDGERTWAPVVDIVEDEKNFVLTADLPDVDQKDIDVRVDESTLTLRAERKLETNESNDKYRRIERSYGKFVRRFSLPETIDVEGIDANYKNGVLRLTLPKTELKDKGRTISVN